MKTVAAELAQQSHIADEAAWRLRDMSCGHPTPQDLRTVATALEQSVSKLRRMAFAIENRKE